MVVVVIVLAVWTANNITVDGAQGLRYHQVRSINITRFQRVDSLSDIQAHADPIVHTLDSSPPSSSRSAVLSCARTLTTSGGISPIVVIVTTPLGWSASETCGGCLVLHRLAHLINTLCAPHEARAYIAHTSPDGAPPDLNPLYHTSHVPFGMNLSTAVFVYPESIFGNPYAAAFFVRWILFYPGMNSGPTAVEIISNNEHIACYFPSYCADLSPPLHSPLLTVIDFQLDAIERAWALPSSSKRSGTLYLDKKKKFYSKQRGYLTTLAQSPSVPGATYISGAEPKAHRLALFRTHERCYIFDPMTFCAIEAALMGCLTVVNPVPGVDPDEWRQASGREMTDAIAYGDGDVSRVLATRAHDKLVAKFSALQIKMDNSVVLWLRDVIRVFSL